MRWSTSCRYVEIKAENINRRPRLHISVDYYIRPIQKEMIFTCLQANCHHQEQMSCFAILFFLFGLFSSLKSKVVPKVHLYVAPSHTILTMTQSLNSQSGPAADALVEKPRFYFCPLYESVFRMLCSSWWTCSQPLYKRFKGGSSNIAGLFLSISL